MSSTATDLICVIDTGLQDHIHETGAGHHSIHIDDYTLELMPQ